MHHPEETIDFHCDECGCTVCGRWAGRPAARPTGPRCLLLGAHRGHLCAQLDEWYNSTVRSVMGEAAVIAQEREQILAVSAKLRPLLPEIEAQYEQLEQEVPDLGSPRGTEYRWRPQWPSWPGRWPRGSKAC